MKGEEDNGEPSMRNSPMGPPKVVQSNKFGLAGGHMGDIHLEFSSQSLPMKDGEPRAPDISDAGNLSLFDHLENSQADAHEDLFQKVNDGGIKVHSEDSSCKFSVCLLASADAFKEILLNQEFEIFLFANPISGS